MFETDTDGNTYFTDPKLLKDYVAIKCNATTEFYVLKGKTVKMTKENLIPRFGMKYAIYAPPKEGDRLSDKYYVREFREMPDYKEYVRGLLPYILDGNIYLLFTPAEVEEMKDMLRRLYKSYHKKEGILDYRKQYIPLLEAYIRKEWYEKAKKHESNYKTCLMQREKHIKYLWELSSEKHTD
jgi:hypothetical protein